MIKKIYITIVLSAWIFMMGILIKQNYIEDNQSVKYFSLGTGIKSIPTDSEWMAIYHNGKKLGYSVFSIYNKQNQGYILSSTTRMKAAIAGLEASIIMDNRVTLDTLFQLNEFEFQLTSDQYSTHLMGRKNGTDMEIITIHGADSVKKHLTVPEELYTYLGIQPLITRQGIRKGDRLRIPSYDPVSMEMDEVEILHEGKETLNIAGEEIELNRIRITYRGIPATRWLDDAGQTYREETLMGLMMERTSAEEALQSEDDELTGLDLLDVYAVIPDQQIGNPESLSELTLEFNGIDSHYFQQLDSRRQTIIKDNPLQVRFTLEPSVLKSDNTEQYLAASDIIQPDREPIIQKMLEITRKDDSNIDKAESLRKWVYSYLNKFPVVSLSSALEILNYGEGDCSEHTILYTSLSRSAGIPTKIHIGMVYLHGKFLYHAWPVILLNGNWVSIDPTLDQTVADVSHIAILESDFTNLSDLIPVLGHISVRVISQTEKGNGL